MKKLMATFLVCVAFTNNTQAKPTKQPTLGFNTTTIEKIIGTTGYIDSKQNLFKIMIPRTDLKVSINGVKFVPAEKLASRILFKKDDNHVKMSGDLILTEDQANVVMSKVLNTGLQVTALHNHFLWESPRILVMHIEGTGTATKLATAVAVVINEITQTQGGGGELPFADIDYSASTISANELNAILGAHGSIQDGMYHLEITPRNKSSDNNKMTLTAAGSEDTAVMDGEIEIHSSQLQSALKTLRKAKVDIVAIHQESADMVAIHFYGLGDLKTMTKGLKVVLNDDMKATQFAKAIDVLPTSAFTLPISSILKITPKLTTPEIAKPIVTVTRDEVILNLKTS